MRKYLLLIGLLTVACNEPSPKTTTTQSSTTTSKDTTTTVAEEKIAPVETLTTDNVIPFLNQYEKENKERFFMLAFDSGKRLVLTEVAVTLNGITLLGVLPLIFE